MDQAERTGRVVAIWAPPESSNWTIEHLKEQWERRGYEVVILAQSVQVRTGFNSGDEDFKWLLKPPRVMAQFELRRNGRVEVIRVFQEKPRRMLEVLADNVWKQLDSVIRLERLDQEETGLNTSQVSEGTSKDVVEVFHIDSELHLSGAPQQEEIIETLLSRMGFIEKEDLRNENGRKALAVFNTHSTLLREFEGTIIRDILLKAPVILLKAGVPRSLQPSGNNVSATENPTSQTGGKVPQFLSKVWEMYLEMDGNRLEHDRGYVMVAVTLIATATFQVGTNPPGVFWQDTTDTHVAGTSILASTKPHEYAVLKFWSTVGLVASLILTILILSGYPVTKKLFMGLLRFATVAMVFSMLMTYLTSVSMVLPSHDRELNRVNEIYKKTVFILAGVCGIAILPPIICLLTWVVDKLPKLFKRGPVSLTKKNPTTEIPISTA